jgi:hypothetical protein
MVIGGYLLIIISRYSINDYWCLFIMAIGHYSINDY